MKSSQIAVVSALGFITLIMIVMAGLGRVAMSQSDSGATRAEASSATVEGELITETFDLEDFQSVAIEGTWQVNLTPLPAGKTVVEARPLEPRRLGNSGQRCALIPMPAEHEGQTVEELCISDFADSGHRSDSSFV